MTNIKSCSFLALFLLSSQAISGANPISWQLNQNFGDAVPVGRTSSITYTLTNQLPFPLVKPLLIKKNASPQSEFSYVDNCSGVRLQSKKSCTVQVNLNPLVNGTKSMQLTIAGYDNNQVPLPQITTEATGQIQSGVQGRTTQSLPSTLQAGVSASYSFVFTNEGKTTASNLSVSVSQTVGTANITYNNCTNSLNSGSSCTVSGVYISNSTSPSVQNVSAQLTFSGASGSPATASTSTIITAPPGDIVGSLVSPNYLPPLIVQGTTHNVQFLFTNVTSGSINLGSNSVTCTDSNGHDCSAQISFIASNNSCNIPSLPTTGACQISGTFTAPAATTPAMTYNIQAQLSFTGTGTPATVVTSGSVVASLPTTRTVTLINQCNFPVWFSLNGSSVSNQTCAAGCPSGTSCNASTGECYWNNYGPNSGTYQLASGGGTTTVTIPTPSFSSNGIQWSGNISASTLCNPSSPSGACGQASCGNSNGSTACSPGIGFTQPATQAEITMNLNTDDSYDVEVINGFHIPISMAPMYYSGIPATANNYTCGIPGGYNGGVTTNGFGSCNWDNAIPPSTKNGYYWVTGGGSSCNINTTTTQCPAGQLCGLNSSFNQTCGNFLGYWSADQVCSQSNLSSTVSNYFLCKQALPGNFPTGATLYSLMACSVPTGSTNPTYNSCYLSYPNYTAEQIQTCCGCVDWWNSSETGGVAIGANSTAASCMSQTDPQWNQYVQPMIQWMKATCPSAYTYPFDDKTSGFSCTNNLPSQPNSTGYLITFCEGNSGLPAGITEGR
ncbi:Dot/Icm T4SS effector LegT [Legionella fallonii]|uniref:Thaumatin domain-containing protein n=1 Tax=Legionella fallonii LLAP-10 TaxID=1212491 RepID=A0A098G403_9GAMM|nr:Dot/Icm T4SS effector LegT [Legionella fallonii]CEG56215.1 Thaumatin domain-containing protein [Legionella fallonii LLAP-10]